MNKVYPVALIRNAWWNKSAACAPKIPSFVIGCHKKEITRCPFIPKFVPSILREGRKCLKQLHQSEQVQKKIKSFHAEIIFPWLVTSGKTSFPASGLLLLPVEFGNCRALLHPPQCAGLELLAPVHKQGSHRGLRDAGVTDTALQMNHSCPIPQGSVLKGINIQSHHSWHMHSVPIKQGRSADDSVQVSKLISKWTKQMQSQNHTADFHLSLIVCKNAFLYACVFYES